MGCKLCRCGRGRRAFRGVSGTDSDNECGLVVSVMSEWGYLIVQTEVVQRGKM